MTNALLRRIVALETKLASLTPPEPFKVVFDWTDDQLEELRASGFKGKVANIVTVCARRCDDSCTSPGGPGCRQGRRFVLPD